MALITDNTKLTVLVLVNFIVKNNCQSDLNQNISDYTKPIEILRDYDEYTINAEPKVIEPERTLDTEDESLNKSKEAVYKTTVPTDSIQRTVMYDDISETDRNIVEKSDTEYDNNRDCVDENEDTVKTTMQDVTETATGYTVSMMDGNFYNRDSVVDVQNESRVNVQSESPSLVATTRSMDSVEETSPRADQEDYESSGLRNPKTETDKQPIDKRKIDKPRPLPALSKSSTLKSWLEDSWLRPPAGILVPLRPLALNRALGVWNELAREGVNVTDVVIVGYDSNGVNWRSRHNLQPSSGGNTDRAVADALAKLLLKYQGVYSDSTNDGTMRALASAAKLVPYDSALFVVTDKGAGDPQRLPLALRALVEKRLKVYTIWTDPNHPSIESELALQDLRNVSSHTEGEVLPYSLQITDTDGSSNLASETELQEWEPMAMPETRRARITNHPNVDVFDTLLTRRLSEEAITLGIPIENGVTVLRIFIEGDVDHAVLYPPNDAPQIDLYNQTSVKLFSKTSKTNSLTPRDVYLVFPGATLDVDMLSVLPAVVPSIDTSALVGMWHLSIRCDTCDYNLSVTARTDLHLYVEIEPRDILKLQVTGAAASVRESSLVDEFGNELVKLPFSYQPVTDGDGDLEGSMADIIADVPLPTVSASKVYVKIVGRDVKGEPFVRVAGPIHKQTEVRMGRSASIRFPETVNDLEAVEELLNKAYNGKLQYNDSNLLPFGQVNSQVVNQRGAILTSVQIGLSSRLYGSPTDRLQLHFEVTNFREQAVRFNFGAVGELRFLTGIEPSARTVQSGETVNVIVSLTITSNAQAGARDLITFTAYGLEQVSMSAYVYVMNPGETIKDVSAPEVRHNFQGTCLGKQGSDCAENVWSASIILRDREAGLLRVSSSPLGLVFDSNFISGTREEVMTTYRATCCSTRVLINAVDALGNTNSYTVDISNYINEAGIAAIVLGVILLIAIIAITIALIYWCVKRRKESRELPSYATRNIS
ncbi:uncharacterized protein LOC123879740 [Maniola jurtina]|uniref:uncharacterized protein LOC123879740 n=1 Tax=Maniola jurtina TaxID=191418 RepID=UPI001E68C96A|nr:uncharacterized protein LOC123879740 [Maniola jurtina]XP_045783598.1 uncharacterized protein LOC123879740 [Maniola jurtina]XP_045783599.1 uncharacterized protein LOC123879740 [Maniola jurtina]XP_045783600.1 uncharacterized protein LOC123879740 [Maniola jurtina]XP_045783602.1 uncharacterized protein LOC123879740 [Maniola jurtina]